MPTRNGDIGCMRLKRWQLFMDVERANVHVVGYDVEKREGHVSTPLSTFNRRRRVARSQSGQRYVLLGDPGYDALADCELRRWLRTRGEPDWLQVTQTTLGWGLKTVVAIRKRALSLSRTAE